MIHRDTTIPVEKKKNFWGFGIFLVIFKFITKIAKMAKVIKVALFGASLASYTYLYNWKFACMIVATILFHEYGHFVAMKKCGVKTKGIYLIPFVGGAAIAEENFKSRRDESFIALMGPWFGLAMSLGIGSLYYVTGNALFAVGGAWMAMINLFNLLPVNPLDGGRVIKSIAFSLHSIVGMIFLTLGLIGGLLLAIYLKSGIFILLLAVGLIEAWSEWVGYRNKKKKLTKEKDKLKAEFTTPPPFYTDPYDKNNKHTPWSDIINKDENDKAVDEEFDKVFPEMPVMNRNQMLWYFTLYIATIMALAYTMHIFSHVPGAALAKEMFK